VLTSLPPAETAQPERPTVLSSGLARIDRIGLSLGVERNSQCDIEGEDPLSANAASCHTQTLERDGWRVRIETHMRMSCTYDAFQLQATLLAWEGDDEVCRREWDYSVPRDLL
jgi:hypothetical protein